MEKLMIFDIKSGMIYQGYWKGDPGACSFVGPTNDSWSPFEAFNLSMDDVISKGDDYDFNYSLGCIENASYVFQTVLEGIKTYNANHPNTPFEASLIITTLEELRKRYKTDCDKKAYLNEPDEDKAAKLYERYNKDVSRAECFKAGVKWANQIL